MKRNGISNTWYAVRERMEQKRRSPYEYVSPDDAELAKQRNKTYDVEGRPSITLVLPAYNTPEIYLKKAVESVLEQTYPYWNLVVCDSSDTDSVSSVIDLYKNDSRIHFLRLKENKGISENTNAGIRYAIDNICHICSETENYIPKSEYIGFLDHDDLLTPDALYRMAEEIIAKTAVSGKKSPVLEDGQIQDMDVNQNGQNNMFKNACDKAFFDTPVLFYSDEDKICEDPETGNVTWTDPHRKYDFNYDLLLTNNYICHLMLIRADLLTDIHFRKEYDGSQDFDLVLQIIAKLAKHVPFTELEKYVCHVPHILYHWRIHPGSTAANTASKTYAYDAGLGALADFLNTVYFDSSGDVKYDENVKEYVITHVLNGKPAKIRVIHSKHLGFYNVLWGSVYELFDIRKEVGAVIGRVPDNNGRMASVMYDKTGTTLFAGINMHYAGDFNRFDSTQDVYSADTRYLTVRPELEELLKTATDRLAFAETLRTRDYLILYIPSENNALQR